MKISVLGTEYTIFLESNNERFKKERIAGFAEFSTKEIHINKAENLEPENKEQFIRETIRHELMHAFLYESGLDASSINNWATNEEMIDWFAIQSPKLQKAFEQANAAEA
ncbi:MAG: hypothetical protein IJR47_04890 [Clostridia bacterium]|nr:hypothetical protein [Clostridia bacterium]